MFQNYDFKTIQNVVELSREIPDSLKIVWLKALS